MSVHRRDLVIAFAAAVVTLLGVLLFTSITDHGSDEQRPSAPRPSLARDATAAARESIARNAVRYQKALSPKSPDDPCRYMTFEAANFATLYADPALRARGCKATVRAAEAKQARPLWDLLDLGVKDIQFSPRVQVAGGSAAGAMATWRGDGTRSATFVERDGQWVIAR